MTNEQWGRPDNFTSAKTLGSTQLGRCFRRAVAHLRSPDETGMNFCLDLRGRFEVDKRPGGSRLANTLKETIFLSDTIISIPWRKHSWLLTCLTSKESLQLSLEVGVVRGARG